ncbi:MAG: polyphosphate kinase [Thermoleophilaceae bacterium]|jgi:polyphosphate kinase|nr:polyphosphate kinase [Thermoleophilaceae bacterium]
MPEATEERSKEAPEETAELQLDSTELYENRELSWLDFNDRVLQLAEGERLPLLERVKFLAIYSMNLDEFFMVRVAGHHDQVDARIDSRGPDGLSPLETIEQIAERVTEQAKRHTHQWEEVLRSELEEHGIRIVTCEECSSDELEAADRAFQDQIFPALTPLAVGPGRPFPYISNLSLSLAVWVRDPASGHETFARVKVPKEVLPRFVSIGKDTFITLESVIARNLDKLFPGMEVVSHSMFRVTRDADFTVSDEADDLLRAVEYELRRRRFGEVVRLEVGADMDPGLRQRLVQWLEVEERQVYDVEGMIDLGDLWEIYGIDGHADLRDPPWSPVTLPEFQGEDGQKADVFEAMRAKDLLVHQPYDSFATSVERLVQQAVKDPDVLAIKLTVYRTSDDSTIIPSLIEAAERGKQTVCMVELKARFDERRNIGWARSLEEAGAHVVHGLPGLKTHTKALMIVRREGKGVRHYVHVGTGNYNAKTARLYEDFGLMTTDEEITADVADLFNSLTGYARPGGYRKVLVAPALMREGILKEIEETVRAFEDGDEDARIAMKMNSLVDQRSIEALYRASQAGVRIDLNVRGICCLRPGIEGVSENIRVVSVVGQFLEHSRIYSFHRGDEHRYWIGSADLMPRNLDNRVELLAPVEAPELQAELEDTLERCFADDTFAWELQADGTWDRRSGGERSVHAELRERALERAAAAEAAEVPSESPAGVAHAR